jgi:peptide/nickel transport system ATP-binding protein
MNEVIVKAERLKKWFPVRMGLFDTLLGRKQLFVHAVDGIDFEVRQKEIFALEGFCLDLLNQQMVEYCSKEKILPI